MHETMKILRKRFRRFLPGISAGLMVIITVFLLLLLSLDNDRAPRARIISSSHHVSVGDPVFFDGRDSSDPDNDELEYHWTINGTFTHSEPYFHFSFPSPGNFTVVLKVTDGSGRSDTETTIIDVRGR